MTAKLDPLIRMRADTFRARLRLGLNFPNPVHIPEGLRLSEPLAVRLCDALCVDGDLNLTGCTNLIELPTGLVVRGELTLHGCRRLQTLPESLSYVSGLSLIRCERLNSLPATLTCSGPVTIEFCPALQCLPTGLNECRLKLDRNVTIDSDRVNVRVGGRLPTSLIQGLPGTRVGSLLEHQLLRTHPVLDRVIKAAKQDLSQLLLIL